MKTHLAMVLLLACFSPPLLRAQALPEGIWEGYDGEWKHVSQQLNTLAEATPPEKFAWRPAPGVRSTSEVHMHIAIAPAASAPTTKTSVTDKSPSAEPSPSASPSR